MCKAMADQMHCCADSVQSYIYIYIYINRYIYVHIYMYRYIDIHISIFTRTQILKLRNVNHSHACVLRTQKLKRGTKKRERERFFLWRKQKQYKRETINPDCQAFHRSPSRYVCVDMCVFVCVYLTESLCVFVWAVEYLVPEFYCLLSLYVYVYVCVCVCENLKHLSRVYD